MHKHRQLIFQLNLFVIVAFMFLQPVQLYAASVLDQHISINANNENIKSVLDRIENIADITFSYKSDVIDQAASVTISVTDSPIQKILSVLFPSNDIGFYALNTQVILYTKRNVANTETHKSQTEQIKKTVYDTVQFIDTVTFIDTVYMSQFDTVTVYDTVFINKQKSPTHTQPNRSYLIEIQQSSSYGLKQDYEISEPYLTGNVSAPVHYSASVLTGVKQNNFSITTGLGFSIISQRADYIQLNTNTLETISKKEYYKTDIDSVWIAMPGYDTLWVQKVDSAQYISSDTIWQTDSAYKHLQATNKSTYLTIPVHISYTKQLTEKWSLGVSTAILSYIRLNNSGLYDKNGSLFKHSTATAYPVFIYARVSLTFGCEVFPKLFLNLGPEYGTALTPIYTEHRQRRSFAGFKISLTKEF